MTTVSIVVIVCSVIVLARPRFALFYLVGLFSESVFLKKLTRYNYNKYSEDNTYNKVTYSTLITVNYVQYVT